MKNSILSALILLPAVVLAQSNSQFNIKVSLGKESKAKAAYLIYPKAGTNTVDSAVVNKGTFLFSGFIAGPVKATIIMDYIGGEGPARAMRSGDALTVYLENGDIFVNSKDSVKNSLITGSAINAENARYRQILAGVNQKLAALDHEYYAAPEKLKDTVYYNALMTRYDKISGEKENMQYRYIKQNPSSFVSLTALIEVAGDDIDVPKIEPVFAGLSIALKSSETGIAFSKAIDDARATSIGAMAPAFTQNDSNNKPVSLADFKGKYVLVDFWASWCGPCRAENPNLVKAYAQYKNRNFTILGVSLDRPGKRQAWIDAVKADRLEWIQVSDLNYFRNEVARKYNIHAIPQNFLIDPTGKIIAKNLRGNALIEKLKQITGS